MGWSHPDVSLEDMMKLIKGFVDILILASGYQSSGQFAHWDTQNIKRAFQWGLFFENVIRQLNDSHDYQDSLNELDAVLLEIKSNPSFPQGLAQISSISLSRARIFVLEHLIQNLTLRDAHLKAFLTASIGMDLDELSGTEKDCVSVYINKLMLQNSTANMKTEPCTDDDFTTCTLKELLKRQLAVSCVSSTERGLDILSRLIEHNNRTDMGGNSSRQLNQAISLLSQDQLVDFITWNQWRSKNLSYLLDKRTVKLVSGASLIFSAPKVQWVQLFEGVNISGKIRDDDYFETIVAYSQLKDFSSFELLLLGCIERRWSSLLECFMSVSYDFINIPQQYNKICNLLIGRSQSLHSKEGELDLKEIGILEYLNVLVGSDPHLLWKLSPILVAFALPSWSSLFRLYLSNIHTQFKGCSSTTRYCSCTQDKKDHTDWNQQFLVEEHYQVRDLYWCAVCSGLFLSLKQGVKRIQFLKLGTRILSGPAVELSRVERRAPVVRCCRLYFFRQLVWKLRSQWKDISWKRSMVQFSYDPYSYSQNFDDGFFHDHVSPCIR